ncbi:hypothetical protein U1Q18_008583, partial [Sarracenia purpurea var. burkii]
LFLIFIHAFFVVVDCGDGGRTAGGRRRRVGLRAFSRCPPLRPNLRHRSHRGGPLHLAPLRRLRKRWQLSRTEQRVEKEDPPIASEVHL